MKLPFLPTRIGLGTDVLKYNPQIKTIVSPYADGRELVAMPALELDAALIHVDRADARGVCQIKGPDHYMDDVFARAARETFVSCDELVESSFFASAEEARHVYWERSETTGVVHIPGGAHPSSCNPLYGFDVAHFKTYAASAGAENGWQEYMQKYVGASEEHYREQVGGLAAIRKLALPTY